MNISQSHLLLVFTSAVACTIFNILVTKLLMLLETTAITQVASKKIEHVLASMHVVHPGFHIEHLVEVLCEVS